MKLIEGNKYNILFPTYTEHGLYYAGKYNDLGGQTCDCCGKELETGYLFFKPSGVKNKYQECCNGSFAYQIAIGNTCKRKIKIIPECDNTNS